MGIRKALYPGSFDPITNGHLDIIERATKLFDKVVVAVGDNPDKEPLFSLEERLEMIRESLGKREDVEIARYSGLTAQYASDIHATAIIRGLRAISDFEYEFQMALANREIRKNTETIFLMPGLPYVFLNSTMVKAIARMGGDVSKFVPSTVLERIKKKYPIK